MTKLQGVKNHFQSPPSISCYVGNQLTGVNGAWGNVGKSGP
jgi:hypothetical protein